MTKATLLAIMDCGTLIGLQLQNEGETTSNWYYGDHRPTLQALEALFPDNILPRGAQVAYSLTDWGTLASLADPDTVVDDDAVEAAEGKPAGA